MEKALGDSDYSHVAIYAGDGKMYEATVSHGGVTLSDLNQDMDSQRSYQIIRPPYKSEESVQRALDYASQQTGKPYDMKFNTADAGEFYCAELVAGALKAADPELQAPVTALLGREAYFPNNFQRIDGAQVVYDDNVSFAESMAMHDPALLRDMIGGAVGGLLTAVGIDELLSGLKGTR